jgi:hypothetical protein
MIANKLKTMKNIILLITLTIASLSCKAQNTINRDEITINGHVIIGENKSVLISNFGTPLEIEKGYSEMDEVDMYIYKYNGAVFYVMKNLIDSFSIIGSEYSLTKHDIKIGDNIEKLKDIFPLSYEKKNKTNLSLSIINPDYKFFGFSFNEDNKIKSMSVGSY